MNKIIVVDTSVLISALIGPKGPSREVLRKCLRREFKPLISNALFLEYEDVSNRENILRQCVLTKMEIKELMNAFFSVCSWVPIYYLWRPNIVDENDNFLVELAIAGNASFIVTNNIKDFENAELDFNHLQIVTPANILRGS